MPKFLPDLSHKLMLLIIATCCTSCATSHGPPVSPPAATNQGLEKSIPLPPAQVSPPLISTDTASPPLPAAPPIETSPLPQAGNPNLEKNKDTIAYLNKIPGKYPVEIEIDEQDPNVVKPAKSEPDATELK